ncbi:MAG: hypothetical protein HY924_03060 [Elusimicrobia bacterium]|nr:hypothetical protein [Elusimicrobiota bacterium]
MNKKLLGALVAAVAVTLFWAKLGPAVAEAGHEGHHGEHGKAMMCPAHVEGAQVKVDNTADGVVITITAQDPKAVKDIQVAAAHMGMKEAGCSCCGHKASKAAKGKEASKSKGEIYVCSMGCYKGPKTADGRCPKCGMNLEKEKK